MGGQSVELTNELVARRLEGIRKALISFYKSARPVSSADVTCDECGNSFPVLTSGDEREIFVSHFLRQLLPPHYRIGSGVITDAGGQLSTQLDIVVELPFTPSFSFLTTSPRTYLADTVGAVIEVKSSLQGYLTGNKQGNVEQKFIKGATKYRPLAEIEREVIVVDEMVKRHEQDEDSFQADVSYHCSRTIPSYIVGYTGWKRSPMTKLRKELGRINGVNIPGRRQKDIVRGILQLDPPFFVASDSEYDCKGTRALGEFVNSLHFELHRSSPLSWPKLRSYFPPNGWIPE